jgi:hypothetical protein
VRALFYKAREVWLDVNGDSRYRFLPGHQGALHVLSGPECAEPQLDGGNWRHMELTERSGDASESFGLTFSRIPFSC